MRRLPGPASSRLSEGEQTPEALHGLFRDWQRTQTQSSVRAPRSLRQQMDVWFCESGDHQPRGNCCVWIRSDHITSALSQARPEIVCFSLDTDLHGRRQYEHHN
jgi:hypothetical protein